MIDMKGKVAVILGVANNRSIAYSIAEKLANAGATLVLCYQSERLKKESEDLIESLGQTGTARAIQCDLSRDEEIDAAVAIVIEPGRTDRPPVHLDASFRSDIFEGAVAFIAIENGSPVAGDEQIDKPIIVKVRGNRSYSVDIRRYARLVGDIGKCAVSIVPVEMIVRRSGGRLLERIRMHPLFQRLAAGHVEIREAVIVVIEPDAAGAGAFQQRAQLLRAETVRELNA